MKKHQERVVAEKEELDEVGHDGIVEAGIIENDAEQLSTDGATPASLPQGAAGQVSEEFEKELTTLINRHSIENMADMPDFLLARMLCAMIESMGPTVKATLDWHGCSSVCHPSPNVTNQTSSGASRMLDRLQAWHIRHFCPLNKSNSQ